MLRNQEMHQLRQSQISCQSANFNENKESSNNNRKKSKEIKCKGKPKLK